MHTNECGLFNVQERGGYEYFIDYSRYWIQLSNAKEIWSFWKVNELIAEAKNKLGKSLKKNSIRCGWWISWYIVQG